MLQGSGITNMHFTTISIILCQCIKMQNDYRVYIFSSPEVQKSLCCHPVVGVGVGVSTHKLIDHSYHTNWATSFISAIHMPWSKTFPCMPKCWPLWPWP